MCYSLMELGKEETENTALLRNLNTVPDERLKRSCIHTWRPRRSAVRRVLMSWRGPCCDSWRCLASSAACGTNRLRFKGLSCSPPPAPEHHSVQQATHSRCSWPITRDQRHLPANLSVHEQLGKEPACSKAEAMPGGLKTSVYDILGCCGWKKLQYLRMSKVTSIHCTQAPPEKSALRPQAEKRRPRAFCVDRGRAPSAVPASSLAGGGRMSSTLSRSPVGSS